MLVFRYDPVGKGDYIRYETAAMRAIPGHRGYSGRLGPVVSGGAVYRRHCRARIIANRDVIADMIRRMNAFSK
jgi:hypothetical protein